MATIVTRAGKGSPLTHNEVDANFTGLNDELATAVQMADVATVALSGAYGDLTGIPGSFTPAAHNQTWATITATPTTLAGYGISDAAADSHTHVAADVSNFSEAVDDRVAALVVAGANITVTYNDGANTLTFDATGGGGLSDGDYGDITVGGAGTTLTIDNGAVTLAKMANMATDSFLGRDTAAAGVPEVLSAATARSILNVADGATAYTDEQAQDAVGAALDTTLEYVDATALFRRAALTGAITAPAGSNATSLGSFTLAQLNTAINDGDISAVSVVASRIYRNSNQSIPTGGSYTSLSWNTAGYETGGDFWSSGATVTIPETGIYQITAEATFDGAGLLTIATCNMQILVNGSTVIGDDEIMVAIGGKGSLFVFAQRSFTAGDTMVVQVKHSDSGSLNILVKGDHSPDIILAKIGGAVGATGPAATPGGNTTEVQYNNAGALGGAANVEIEGGNLRLVNTSDPSAPSGAALLYSKLVGGKGELNFIDPNGLVSPLQTGLNSAAIFLITPTNSTIAPNQTGGNLTSNTTVSHQQTIASSNPWQATRRTRWTSTTSAGNATGCRTAYVQWFLGNAAGFGGFKFNAQFGQSVNLNGGQKFVGLCALTSILAGNPSALVTMAGMGYDATDADTGNWFFMYNDASGTATRVDLGTDAARNTTHGYDLTMFAKPNSAEIFVRIVNLHSGVVVLDTSYTSDIPAVNTGLAFKCECRNGAVAAATDIELARAYIETDY